MSRLIWIYSVCIGNGTSSILKKVNLLSFLQGNTGDAVDDLPIVSLMQKLTGDSTEKFVKYWIDTDQGNVILRQDGLLKPITSFTVGSFSTVSIDGIPLFSITDGTLKSVTGMLIYILSACANANISVKMPRKCYSHETAPSRDTQRKKMRIIQ